MRTLDILRENKSGKPIQIWGFCFLTQLNWAKMTAKRKYKIKTYKNNIKRSKLSSLFTYTYIYYDANLMNCEAFHLKQHTHTLQVLSYIIMYFIDCEDMPYIFPLARLHLCIVFLCFTNLHNCFFGRNCQINKLYRENKKRYIDR